MWQITPTCLDVQQGGYLVCPKVPVSAYTPFPPNSNQGGMLFCQPHSRGYECAPNLADLEAGKNISHHKELPEGALEAIH